MSSNDRTVLSNLPQNSQSVLATFISDDLIEKLKLLSYERNLLSELKMKPLSRFYFVKSLNPGEQFYMFTLICWWLCQQLGKDFEKPQESDDPHNVTAKIIAVLNELNVSTEFNASQLIRGAGASCLYILDTLANHAIKALQISFHGPVRVLQEEKIVSDHLNENAEIILEKIDEEVQGNSLTDDDGDDNLVDLGTNLSGKMSQYVTLPQFKPIKNNIEQFNDPQFWRMELEEVLSILKVYVKRDVKDWRTHLAQMVTLKESMYETVDITHAELKRLHHEFTFTLEKFESRENHLNSELGQLLLEYKKVATELSSIQVTHKKILEESSQSNQDLQAIINENNSKKAEMEQLGQMMSDSSYVQKIKNAVSKLRKEVSQLNLEVAILINSIDRDIIGQMRPTDIDDFN